MSLAFQGNWSLLMTVEEWRSITLSQIQQLSNSIEVFLTLKETLFHLNCKYESVLKHWSTGTMLFSSYQCCMIYEWINLYIYGVFMKPEMKWKVDLQQNLIVLPSFHFSVSQLIPENGCCSLRFKAVQRGHTTVTASYSSRGIELSATVTIAAYDPLVVNNKITFW